jgi:hypothetical protein
MDNIVMERAFDPRLRGEDFDAMVESSVDCLPLYRATWHESVLATDGSALICRFQAPDSESIRMLSRGDGSISKNVWTGTVHDTGRPGLANVVVERRFEEPTTLDEIQALEDAATWCLDLHKVTFLRTFFSADHKHMICLYQAPDAESVRLAQQQAKMPVNKVWACLHHTPDNIFS